MKVILFILLSLNVVMAGLPPTSSKGNGESSFVTTFKTDYGTIPVTRSGTTLTLGTIPVSKGGTGATAKAAAFDALSPMTTSGDIVYGGASGTGTRLAVGGNGSFLKVSGGVPTWATFTAVDSPSASLPTICGGRITSAGAVSFQYGGCVSNCTSSSTYTCTFTSSYWNGTPACVASDVGAGYGVEVNTDSTAMYVRTQDITVGGTPANVGFNFICFGSHQ